MEIAFGIVNNQSYCIHTSVFRKGKKIIKELDFANRDIGIMYTFKRPDKSNVYHNWIVREFERI